MQHNAGKPLFLAFSVLPRYPYSQTVQAGYATLQVPYTNDFKTVLVDLNAKCDQRSAQLMKKVQRVYP